MELIQVFNWLSMPDEIGRPLVDCFERVNDDSYHRWYPHKMDEHGFDVGVAADVDRWLIDQGMQRDENNKYFYVLIYISW